MLDFRRTLRLLVAAAAGAAVGVVVAGVTIAGRSTREGWENVTVVMTATGFLVGILVAAALDYSKR